MKNLKKFVAIMAAAAMTLSMVACSSEKTTTSSDTKKESKETTTEDSGSTDLFDVANYKSDKDKSEWTIAVVTKDNTANWFKRMECPLRGRTG